MTRGLGDGCYARRGRISEPAAGRARAKPRDSAAPVRYDPNQPRENLPMPLDYAPGATLFEDDLATCRAWRHEGTGRIAPIPGGGMRLHCEGSRQGGEGCMAFFEHPLPDCIAVEYEIVVHSHGGLVINFLAMRGLRGEDLFDPALRPRTGVFANYTSAEWGLQSFHVSFSRFNDAGVHTATSNWRRNPGLLLVGHGIDPVQAIGRPYRIRLTKDHAHCQMEVDGAFAHACVDRADRDWPVPDHGRFGFRLIGSDVKADIRRFRVTRIASHPEVQKLLRRDR